MIEKNEFLENCLSRKRGTLYDVAISYSGGKDSAFLIYLLKEVYHLRVIAISIDNGFEFPGVIEELEQFPQNVGVPLRIISPDKEFFIELYKNLIINPKELKDKKRNHICHVCNNIIWNQVALFAYENNIPFVASGLGLEQLNSGRIYPLEIDQYANRIAEKSTKKISQIIRDYVKNNNDLENNPKFMEQFERLSKVDNSVSTIYPYIYHSVPVNEIKRILVEYGNWRPLTHQDIDSYISSGCLIMTKIVMELEKMDLIILNEREEAKRMYDSGLLDENQVAFAYQDKRNQKVNFEDPIFDVLGIKDYLIQIATDRGQI